MEFSWPPAWFLGIVSLDMARLIFCSNNKIHGSGGGRNNLGAYVYNTPRIHYSAHRNVFAYPKLQQQ
jgi:hypothetical protein